MTPVRTAAALTAIASLAVLGSYWSRAERTPLTERRAPITEQPQLAVAMQPASDFAPLPEHTARLAAHSAPLDEAALMRALRALGPQDTERTLQLAREGNARFPNGPDAAERAWTIVKALTTEQRFREARDEAQLVVQRYPDTSWARDVERHLLTHPLDLPSREEQQELDRAEAR